MAGGFSLHPRRLDRERITSAVAVAAVHVALGWALLTGLGVSLPQKTAEVLAAFDVGDPPPPPKSKPPPLRPKPVAERAPRDEGAAAPPNLIARATEVTTPDTPIPLPPPVTVAEQPGPGVDPTAGNAATIGPGTGAGGFGEGTGSGRYGNGPGGGGYGGAPVQPLRSSLGNLNCPDAGDDEGPRARRYCPSVEVEMRLTVSVEGRVVACRLTGPSGDAAVDGTVCRRAQERMRFRAARDAAGRKVAATITWVHDFEARVTREDAD